jgi:hypothetical protein
VAHEQDVQVVALADGAAGVGLLVVGRPGGSGIDEAEAHQDPVDVDVHRQHVSAVGLGSEASLDLAANPGERLELPEELPVHERRRTAHSAAMLTVAVAPSDRRVALRRWRSPTDWSCRCSVALSACRSAAPSGERGRRRSSAWVRSIAVWLLGS